MGLKLTLRPNERVVVNGCVIRNSDRRNVLTIETPADVVRSEDLLNEDAAATPVKQAYFLIQTALIRPDTREALVPVIQEKLADLVGLFNQQTAGGVVEAATCVSVGDYYKAMSALRPVMRHEAEVLDYIAAREAGLAAAPDPASEKV